MLEGRPQVRRTYAKRGPPLRAYRAAPDWIPKSPEIVIVSSGSTRISEASKSPEMDVESVASGSEDIPETPKFVPETEIETKKLNHDLAKVSASHKDTGNNDHAWVDEDTAPVRLRTSRVTRKTSAVVQRKISSTSNDENQSIRCAILDNCSTTMNSKSRPIPPRRHVYRRHVVISDSSDSEDDSSMAKNVKVQPLREVLTQPVDSLFTDQNMKSEKVSALEKPEALREPIDRPKRPTYRRSLIKSPQISFKRRPERPLTNRTEISKFPITSVPKKLPFNRSMLSERTNFQNSPKAVSSCLPTAKQSSISKVDNCLQHPMIKMLLNAENSPIARRVRGRMSLVTSSARRRRIQQRPINETTQPVKPLANSPLATLSAPHITPIKTFNSQKNIKAGRLAVASPLCRRQPVLSPYITIPPNRGIESLLKTCNQDSVLDFSTSIKNLCSKFRPETGLIGNWIKVGEASYSEVYCWSSPKVSRNSSVKMNEQIVMKVIPIRRPGRQAKHISTTTIDHSDDSRKSDPNESPAETDWADAEKEVKLTKLLGSSSSIEGFIDFRGCLVVSGAYPKVLLKEWDKYKRRFPQQSYNPRPSKFHIKQLYCCILLRNSGTDLESFEVLDWQQAASIFSQVINTLSQGERKYRFEHRDLHWGNILVEPVESSKLNHNQTVSSSKRAEKHIEGIAKLLFETKLDSPLNPLDPSSSGVSVSIIDYGLSRANLPSSLNISKKGRDAQKAEQVVWTKPDSDIFGGSSTNSDYQFMCYDLMNISMKNKPWSEFNPTTNFIWLHYVVKKLIEEKGLSAPPSLTKSQNNDRPICSQAQQNLSERVTREKSTIESKCYKLLVESEKALGSLIQIKVPSLASSKPTTRSNLGRKIDSRGFLDEFCGIDGSDELSASMFLNWWNLQQNETFQN